MTSRRISPARKVAAVAGVGLSMWFLTAPAFAEKPADVGGGKPAVAPNADDFKGVAEEKAQPPGQERDGKADDNGFTCDGNGGVGNGNPAFDGCNDTDPGPGGPKPVTPEVIVPEEIIKSEDPELGEGRFLEKTPAGIVSRDPADPAASAPPAVVVSAPADSTVLGNEVTRETAEVAAPAGRPTEVKGVQVVRGAAAAGAPAGLAATGSATTSGMLRIAGFVLSLGGALMALAQRRPAGATAA